jgi:COP9 signalosome complex subunit 1
MDMDFDEPEVGRIERRTGKQPLLIPVDDAHPFDLDAYISNYTGA